MKLVLEWEENCDWIRNTNRRICIFRHSSTVARFSEITGKILVTQNKHTITSNVLVRKSKQLFSFKFDNVWPFNCFSQVFRLHLEKIFKKNRQSQRCFKLLIDKSWLFWNFLIIQSIKRIIFILTNDKNSTGKEWQRMKASILSHKLNVNKWMPNCQLYNSNREWNECDNVYELSTSSKLYKSFHMFLTESPYLQINWNF